MTFVVKHAVEISNLQNKITIRQTEHSHLLEITKVNSKEYQQETQSIKLSVEEAAEVAKLILQLYHRSTKKS